MDLAALVQDVVERHRDHLQGPHSIDVQVTCDDCHVKGDRDRLEQVVLNLLTNAVKYAPAGGPIDVRIFSDPSHVLLSFQDCGIGLPADALESTFEPFGRAENATQRHLPGLGLGLHISRQIVDLHGGQLWVESGGLEQGATFTMRVPRAM